MFNPEEFRRQLEEGLAERRQTEKQTVREKNRQAQLLQQATNLERKNVERETRQKERERNQIVVGLDKQLPIGEFLEVLKNKIIPLEYVRRFGPERGVIGYSFIYSGGVELVNEPIGRSVGSIGKGGYHSYFDQTGQRRGIKIDRNIFAVTIDYNGILAVGEQTRSIIIEDFFRGDPKILFFPWPTKIEGINPLKEERPSNLASINIYFSDDGLQQFGQALTKFYVGLKTGQGK